MFDVFFFFFFFTGLSQVVTIDLKDEKLTPGKKYYERIHNSLDKLLDLKFDVIVSWDPPGKLYFEGRMHLTSHAF